MNKPLTPATSTSTSLLPATFDDRLDDRLEFWRGVADAFGVSDGAVDEALVRLEPLTVVDLLLPGRSAEERSEVMWALGEFLRRSDAADTSSTSCCGAAACHSAA